MKKEILKVKEIIKSNLANDNRKGKLIYEKILPIFKNDKETLIFLDFSEITIINTAFLNDAIGVLFRELELTQVTSRLRINNIDEEDIVMFKEVLRNAAEKFMKSKNNKKNI